MSEPSDTSPPGIEEVALVRFAGRLGAATSLDELERRFLAGFSRVLHAPMYGFNLFVPETHRPERVVAANVSESFIARYEREAMHIDPVLQSALRTGRPAYNRVLMSADEWLESRVYRAAYWMHEVHHVVEIPILAGDGIVGNLHFADSAPDREFRPREIRLAEALGRIIGQVVERLRVRRRLELERDHARAALELSDTAVVVSEPAATEPRLNDAARALAARVAGVREHLHWLTARNASAGPFSRRAEVELADGERGVLHGHSTPIGAAGGLVTVLELESGERRTTPASLAALTPREVEVATLVAEGLGDREIAARLILSHHTVSQYVKRIYRKLEVSSRVDLTRLLLGARVGAGRN